jgi:hypothetical protein
MTKQTVLALYDDRASAHQVLEELRAADYGRALRATLVRPSGLLLDRPCCSAKPGRGSPVTAHRRCGIQHPSMPPGKYGKFQDCSELEKTPSSPAYPSEAVFIPES